jgi:hypothetical protein
VIEISGACKKALSPNLWLMQQLNTGRSRFDPWQRRKDFSYSLCVQTGSGAHPASCPMGTGGPFLGVKRGRGVTLTTHSHLVPRSRMSRGYISPPPQAPSWRVVGQLYLSSNRTQNSVFSSSLGRFHVYTEQKRKERKK